MPWHLGMSLKKRVCRYMLQRYLGNYLKEKLTLEQLSVDLYGGTGTITDLNLDVDGLNEMAETYNLPIEFVDGYIQSISVTVPWASLLKENSFMEVQGLSVTIQPRQRDGNVMNSLWGSMTTSMQLAQECLRQNDHDMDADPPKPYDGLETFAQTIDSVLCRIKVRFVDTTVRLEHVPKGSRVGVALEIRVMKVDYFDEAGTESGFNEKESRNVYEPAAFTCKNLHWEGVTLYTDEFPSNARTFSKSVIGSIIESSADKNSDAFATAPETPELDSEQNIFESCLSASLNPNAFSSHSPNLPNLSTQPDPILIAKLSGRHEIRIKLKQCENIQGPQVFVDFTFGSLVLFLSPRQVHILKELLSGLTSPDVEDDSNVIRHYKTVNKPMQAADFERVEQELQKQLAPQCKNRSLQHQQGWSSQSLEDSDDEFLPVAGSSNRMTSSFASDAGGHSSDGESVLSSSSGPSSSCQSYQTRVQRKSRKSSTSGPIYLLADDPTAELTHFKVQLSSLVVIVLHDDVLTTAVSGSGLIAQSSVLQMKAQAEKFFGDLGVFMLGGSSKRDLATAHERLSSACKANHLRFIGAPCTLEGTDKTSSTLKNISLTMSFGISEVVECLFDKKSPPSQPIPEYSALLGFPREKGCCPNFLSASLAQPCLKIKINYWEQLNPKSSRSRNISPPRTEIQYFLSSCISEVDITIVDRINCLLNPQELCGRSPQQQVNIQLNNQGFLHQAMDEGNSSVGHKLDVSVTSPFVVLKVRFPVPDLRPLHDMDRAPWWKKTVRNDVLILELTDARFNTVFDECNLSWTANLRCRELHGLFQERPNDPPVSFLRASAGNLDDEKDQSEVDGGFDWPKISIRVNPPSPLIVLEEQEQEDSDEATPKNSIDTVVNELCTAEAAGPSLFSTHKIIGNQHGDDSPNQKSSANYSSEGEHIVSPSDRSVAAEFIEIASNNSEYVIELNFANVNVVLPNKHFYEVLYNRITTDLLLWEPAAPRPVARDSSSIRPTSFNLDWANTSMHDTVYQQTFSMCKSALQYDSSSESEEENPSYFSFHEHKQRQKQQKPLNAAANRQNKVCFTITGKQAAITLHTPLRDANQKVVPEHRGEVQVQVVDGTFFSVVTPRGAPSAGYMCFYANQAYMYHKGVLSSISVESHVVAPTDMNVPKHLNSTIYPSESGTITKMTGLVGSGGDSLDMLKLAIGINLDTARNVKTFRIALGIQGATLLHRMSANTESWYSQIYDFFDVIDYPIMGYKPPSVINEFHLHTSGIAFDYRPLYLPLRTMFTMETFSICSNMAAQTSTSVARMIVEDAGLFLSKKLDASSVDLKRDYVCVIDVSFFELLLRRYDGKDQKQPKIDLRASTSMINFRTCVDSCRALTDLLCYFAYDTDLKFNKPQEQLFEEDSIPSSILSDNDTLTNEEEHVHTLMAEAMKESGGNFSSSSESESTSPEIPPVVTGEMFLFPDEAPNQRSQSSFSPFSPHKSGLADVTSDSSSDSLEDFCILENDPGVGIVPRTGEAQIRKLTTEPIHMVENYFSVPLGRMDQLKTPKTFPNPVYRYSLREISVVWHMYGGLDFLNESPGKNESGKSFDSRRSESDLESDYSSDYPTVIGSGSSASLRDLKNAKVAFRKSNQGEVHWRTTASTQRSRMSPDMCWQARGGPGRQHDVLIELQMNKLRFQHEVYPETTTHASRHVLLINDLEIRDRLASSQLNKFLYQYSSESMPRQTHANMVVIKAVAMRPDPSNPMQEYSVKSSALPLRLNIDQDALFFLFNFFSSLLSSKEDCFYTDQGGSSLGSGSGGGSGPSSMDSLKSNSAKSSAPHPVPVMTVVGGPSTITATPTSPQTSLSEHDNLILFDEKTRSRIGSDGLSTPTTGRRDSCDSPAVSSPIYFKSFEFYPDVPIRLDYHGKHVDMEQGALAGLLIGLGQLNCSELRLRQLSFHGILGMDRLLQCIFNEWLQDIKQTQLHTLLGGVGPLHSLVQLIQGIRDLFWLPIEQYRKDGRIVRGLQRGANAFTTSTAMAVLELTNRLVGAIQTAAETAHDIVSPGPSVRQRGIAGQTLRKRPSQPADIREGMTNAYHVVREGLGDTARQIVQVASEEHEHKGVSGAVGGVLRQIPSTVVKPIILATEATSNVLGGMRHQLAPDVRREAAEKWRTED